MKDKPMTRPINRVALYRWMLLGGTVTTLLLIFLLGGMVYQLDMNEGEWGPLWYLRPLIILPLGGSMGGAYCYYMKYVSQGRPGWVKLAAAIWGAFVYAVAFWFSFVVGFSGTFWV